MIRGLLRFILGAEVFQFSRTLVSALEARAYFLLFAQKKVAKEKVTSGSAPGCARSLALLGTPGTPGVLPRDALHRSGRGWLNSPPAQTPPADCPRRSSVAQRLSRGPANHPYSKHPSHRRKPVSSAFSFLDSGFRRNDGVEFEHFPVEPGRFSGPHVERRATQALAEKGRGLSEARRAEFRSPRRRRVAQGSPRRGPRSLGSPFLWLLSFGEAKESTPASKAEPQAN